MREACYDQCVFFGSHTVDSAFWKFAGCSSLAVFWVISCRKSQVGGAEGPLGGGGCSAGVCTCVVLKVVGGVSCVLWNPGVVWAARVRALPPAWAVYLALLSSVRCGSQPLSSVTLDAGHLRFVTVATVV